MGSVRGIPEVSAVRRDRAVWIFAVLASGATIGCSDDDGSNVVPAGSGGVTAGAGAGGTGGAGTGGAGTSGAGGRGGMPSTMPPDPALPADAATLSCPTLIQAALEATDGTQTGRHSRFGSASACGMSKGYPGNGADPNNPHLFDVYRFENSGDSPACFNFTLTYGGALSVDASVADELDAGAPDAAPAPDRLDASVDASLLDASGAAPPVDPGTAKYMLAYGTFFPAEISLEYLADVGDALASPQTMGVTVPAGETIDVVVYAVDVAPAGVDDYTLSCSAD